MDYCCTDQEFQGGSNHEFIQKNVPDFSLSEGSGFPRGIGRECAVNPITISSRYQTLTFYFRIAFPTIWQKILYDVIGLGLWVEKNIVFPIVLPLVEVQINFKLLDYVAFDILFTATFVASYCCFSTSMETAVSFLSVVTKLHKITFGIW